jgi:transcriptional antiterminator NusG
MRIHGLNETERDLEMDDRDGQDRDTAVEEPTAEAGVRDIDVDEEVAPEETRFEAEDPVEVVAAQVTPAAETEPYEDEPVEPEPVEPQPEPVEPEPEPSEPEPEPSEPEPVEPDAVEAEVAAPEAAEPEPVEADVAVPEPVEPETVEPETVEPEPVEPEPVEAKAVEPEPVPAADDPFRGPGDWYVVHTYSGYENKVKANLESRIHTMQMEDKIFGVHIPMEDVMEIKSGKKQVVKKKQFPGYLLVRMIYDNDSWYVVRNTPGVTGFVSAGTGTKPTPLSRHEVEKIVAVKKEEVRPQVRLGFEENDVVRITSGPFADFNGTISEINADQAKLKVLVNIFDRETPVELSFDQVAKV